MQKRTLPLKVAVQTLRNHTNKYAPQLIDQFATMLGAGSSTQEIPEMPLRVVTPGIVFLDDLRTHPGTLLVPKGFAMTEVFLERTRNFGSGIFADKVRVLVTGAQ